MFQKFDLDIIYRPGTRMAHVDAFSRVSVDVKDTELSVDAELSK